MSWISSVYAWLDSVPMFFQVATGIVIGIVAKDFLYLFLPSPSVGAIRQLHYELQWVRQVALELRYEMFDKNMNPIQNLDDIRREVVESLGHAVDVLERIESNTQQIVPETDPY